MRQFFLVILFFSASLSFASEWGTYLSRICEFDAKNATGLMDSGNFIITSEHISYIIDEKGKMDVHFAYRLKKIKQTTNNTFGLSLRNMGQEGRGDNEVDTLNIKVNDKKVTVANTIWKYSIDAIVYDDNGVPVKDIDDFNGDDYNRWFYELLSNGYRGWYYFNIDFPESNEAAIEINYKTELDYGLWIRYNSKPFWIPVSNDTALTVTVENNYNSAFLSDITDCRPLSTLVTENWRLTKSNPNTVVVTYTPGWFSNKKGVWISFHSIGGNPPAGIDPFFEVIWNDRYVGSSQEEGVYLRYRHRYKRAGYGNIIFEELEPYELIFLNRWQLRVMRNTFYARYKYKFNDNNLNLVFYTNYGNGFYDSVPPDNWYNKNFTESIFTPIERKNIEIIQNLENMRP
jgi:hypothetical protein